MSRGAAVILLAVYGMYNLLSLFISQSDFSRYLYFQLKSHAYLYDEVIAEDAEIEHATIPPWWAFGLSLPSRLKTLTIRLVVATVLVAICAEFLVSSIDGLVAGSNISEAFVGLILLPIVGNAAEVLTSPPSY